MNERSRLRLLRLTLQRPHRYRHYRALTMGVTLAILSLVPLAGLARVDLWGGAHRALGRPVDLAIGVTAVAVWDRLKDMAGVMEGFVRHTDRTPHARLALVGPDVESVSDDPEGAAVYAECVEAWRALPAAQRRRVDLVTLPMDDAEENAAMVNAIQRHAAVIVQKSLHEGFGLTVTEAMWKGRPIVASAVGGIRDQVVDGRHGLLVGDPRDIEGFGERLSTLLADRTLARRLGRNARRRCISHFLAPRHLMQYVDLFERIEP